MEKTPTKHILEKGQVGTQQLPASVRTQGEKSGLRAGSCQDRMMPDGTGGLNRKAESGTQRTWTQKG